MMASNNNTTRKEITGLHRITKKLLKELCKKHKLYQTPALNDVLYLHYHGFQCIESLEDYTELKCIWLECNAISEIQGLQNQTKLKCLFLQNNLIKRIENLEHCIELDTLNLSSNHITKVENCGVDILPCLSTLNLSSNYLKDSMSLRELEYCKHLSVLDLSNNRIDDILVVKVFAKMPQLRVLVLQGNPVVSKLPQYRKTLILECKELTYLDSRPVFPKDRACAEAWKRGGYDEERKENDRWNRKDRKKIRDSVNATIRLRNRHLSSEDQVSLLHSSDSENDEIVAAKRRKQNEADAGISLELGTMWDEIENDKLTTTSSSSSEMNVSSTTSVLSNSSNNDSNDNESSANSKCYDATEIVSNSNDMEEKLLNDAPEKQNKVLDLQINISQLNKTDDEKLRVDENPQDGMPKEEESQEMVELEVKAQAVSEDEQEKSQLDLKDEIKESTDGKENEGTVDVLSHPETTAENFQTPEMHSESDIFEKTITDDGYDEVVDAICKLSMNDLSREGTPKRSLAVQLQIEELTNDVDSTLYEPENEIDEIIERMIASSGQNAAEKSLLEEDDNDVTNIIEIKSTEQQEYERQCDKTNAQLVQDFEELSNNMDIKLLELQKDKESRCGDERIVYQDTEIENSGGYSSSDTDLDEEEEKSVEKALEKWNKEFLLKNRQLMGANTVKNSTSFANNGTSCKETQLMLNECAKEKREVESENLEAISITPENLLSSEFERLAISGKSSEAIAAFEKEAGELKALLQRLEDDNERLYNLNNTYRQILENDILEEIKYQDKESSEGCQKLCECIIEDLLEELELQEQKKPVKPKSYEFGDIESDEEFSYSANDTTLTMPQEDEVPSKTIHQVIVSFNEFMNEVTRKNREAVQRRQEERKRIVTSTQQEKTESLKMLLQSPNLQEFNADTNESLDAQLDAMKTKQMHGIQKLVDRVYAQKDRYDDTLDVVDGRLVVVKKDSGEIEELPDRKRNPHEDEDEDDEDDDYNDYKTAPASDNETSLDAAVDRWNMHTTTHSICGGIPHIPMTRKSSEDLIKIALLQQQRIDDAATNDTSYDADDEYHSLESTTTSINTTTKSTLFGELEEQMLNKLDFKQLQIDETDEQHIVQCARSYDELKHLLKSTDKLNASSAAGLTSEEAALLQRMLDQCAKTHETDTSTANEKLLLNKMVERTKAEIESEEQQHMDTTSVAFDTTSASIDESTMHNGNVVKLSSSECMIMLYNYDGAADSNNSSSGCVNINNENNSDVVEIIHESKDLVERTEQHMAQECKQINLENLTDALEVSNDTAVAAVQSNELPVAQNNNNCSNQQLCQHNRNNQSAEHANNELVIEQVIEVENEQEKIKDVEDEAKVEDNVERGCEHDGECGVEMMECSLHVYNYNNRLLKEVTMNVELLHEGKLSDDDYDQSDDNDNTGNSNDGHKDVDIHQNNAADNHNNYDNYNNSNDGQNKSDDTHNYVDDNHNNGGDNENNNDDIQYNDSDNHNNNNSDNHRNADENKHNSNDSHNNDDETKNNVDVNHYNSGENHKNVDENLRNVGDYHYNSGDNHKNVDENQRNVDDGHDNGDNNHNKSDDDQKGDDDNQNNDDGVHKNIDGNHNNGVCNVHNEHDVDNGKYDDNVAIMTTTTDPDDHI